MSSDSNVAVLGSYRRTQSGSETGQPIRTIAVTGGKGGVGKSVVCANLAVALAQQSRRVLLFDSDLGCANADILLGIEPRRTLRDVLRHDIELADAVAIGPAGVALIPGSTGFSEMANLSAEIQTGIISGFSTLQKSYDTLCVDTGPGISDNVTRVAAATQHVIVVVCDEPTSLTDAYAIIKVLHEEKGIDRFQVVTNMVRAGEATAAYDKLRRVADRFLSVVLYHAGSIPYDDRISQAVRARTPVQTAFPRSLAAIALRNLAQRAAEWPTDTSTQGNLQFFAESLMHPPSDGGSA